MRAADLLLLESSTLTFRFEEVVGPEKIRLGVWGYVGADDGALPDGDRSRNDHAGASRNSAANLAALDDGNGNVGNVERRGVAGVEALVGIRKVGRP